MAEGAHDGAEICRRRVPDLVISDVVKPGMNGIELAITIRQQFRGCQILLFSGQAETLEILEDAKRRGYDFELLAKPLQLLGKIKSCSHYMMPTNNRCDDEICSAIK